MLSQSPRRALVAGSIVVAVLLLVSVAASACPNCGDQLEGDRSRGFFWSIVFMMGAPFGVTAAAVTGIVVSTRRRRSREASESVGPGSR